MFDIGFTEMLLVAVIALLVIGPKRLPEVARTLGRWTGKLRNFIAATRADLEREFNSTELRQLLDDKQGEIDELRQMISDTRASINDGVRQLKNSVNKSDDDAAILPSEAPSDNVAGPDDKTSDTAEVEAPPARILTEVQKNALTAKKPQRDEPDT